MPFCVDSVKEPITIPPGTLEINHTELAGFTSVILGHDFALLLALVQEYGSQFLIAPKSLLLHDLLFQLGHSVGATTRSDH